MELYCIKVYDRKQAGILLGGKLKGYHNSNSVIIGISKGGAVVAHTIAKSLNLPLEIFPCRKINHPGNQQRSIGSVCLDGVVIHAHPFDIPQGYIGRQVTVLQRDLVREVEFYDEKWDSISLEGRPVIIVDDMMKSGDTMTACIRSIKNRNPSKILVAVPFVSAEAVLLIEEAADDVIYIRMETEIKSPEQFFEYFPTVNETRVKSLLMMSRKLELKLQ